ncbi:MAG: hypothetical protein LBN23_02160 [Paludibacter sp.]|jgi:hypothetical protein|nr:hypothetical protein [Paludibacter sp.]
MEEFDFSAFLNSDGGIVNLIVVCVMIFLQIKHKYDSEKGMQNRPPSKEIMLVMQCHIIELIDNYANLDARKRILLNDLYNQYIEGGGNGYIKDAYENIKNSERN